MASANLHMWSSSIFSLAKSHWLQPRPWLRTSWWQCLSWSRVLSNIFLVVDECWWYEFLLDNSWYFTTHLRVYFQPLNGFRNVHPGISEWSQGGTLPKNSSAGPRLEQERRMPQWAPRIVQRERPVTRGRGRGAAMGHTEMLASSNRMIT